MDSTASPRWLTIVGIGAEGWDGLPPAGRAAVESAAVLYGGERHLGLVPAVAGQERLSWPSPMTGAFPDLLGRRGQRVCVLASGDPSWYGVGATLSRLVPASETTVIPAPSAFSLAAARLGWPLQDCRCLTVHGRPLELVVPHLQPNAKLLLLSWDGTTPAKLAALLRARGFGASRLTVLEAMGGPREERHEATADGWSMDRVGDLNTIALDCVAAPGARILPLAPGLPDDWFAHDGQITKREVRAVTLSFLAPRRGELLWDVGAGSGSIGIEWMLRDPANRAVAVEHHEERIARILANASALGVPSLALARGRAPAALAGLERPDAIFIGGGLTGDGVLEACWEALAPGGRLAANAVTLESEAVLIDAHRRLGGELAQVAVSRASSVGGFRGWRPAMPVTLWRVEKPWTA
ncbi:precorrin-6y C5,15-methyltransferase (decarboxylating) subunit CbiE [Azospirillum picis]|uniref:Precorrin-6Y C5,15-methyltransferase (Decarboxylating) n=1 Tax=Azospirillum picis TaxID=488438 RepID=A0ABU0MD26_9PROT|nr:precorrin-6y C5,15-methyltransferase (decarboxylating) subunit CbiE [Azospirillum picis]MBP2297638.1 precorrin-6Y C5,15-methyltransferase (decarboxylating) [Azospirillum picis]MDQ0531339.1 precorrin-6Y C5,15-methyltransferase (decarboxylating) [Azospirillum picis]